MLPKIHFKVFSVEWVLLISNYLLTLPEFWVPNFYTIAQSPQPIRSSKETVMDQPRSKKGKDHQTGNDMETGKT